MPHRFENAIRIDLPFTIVRGRHSQQIYSYNCIAATVQYTFNLLVLKDKKQLKDAMGFLTVLKKMRQKEKEMRILLL